MFASVLFGGSRSLSGSAAGSLVSSVVGRVVAAAPGAAFSVGCARGGDAAALACLVRAGAASRCSVFCVGEASGAGFFAPVSAFSGVVSAVAAGASPVWCAGGPLSVPLSARLAARSRAALVPGGVPVSVACWFLASPASRGSLGAARAAAAAGIAVVVFCVGFSSAELPLLGPVSSGRWVPVVAGPFSGGFLWVPAGCAVPAWALPSVSPGAVLGPALFLALGAPAVFAGCGLPGVPLGG